VTLGGGGTARGDGANGGGGGGAGAPSDCLRNRFNWKCLPLLPGTGTATPPQLVTWADLASFRPTVGVAVAEPTDWSIIGLPTNFYVNGGPHVVSGALFGLPADVRFTPVEHGWSYGDGSSSTTTTPGASWASLGLAEFDRTATSHVYRRQGAFTISATITYAAEYQFAGQPWRSVSGTLALPTNSLSLTVSDATTVLVRDGCDTRAVFVGC